MSPSTQKPADRCELEPAPSRKSSQRFGPLSDEEVARLKGAIILRFDRSTEEITGTVCIAPPLLVPNGVQTQLFRVRRSKPGKD